MIRANMMTGTSGAIKELVYINAYDVFTDYVADTDTMSYASTNITGDSISLSYDNSGTTTITAIKACTVKVIPNQGTGAPTSYDLNVGATQAISLSAGVIAIF